MSLFISCERGDIEGVRSALERGEDVNQIWQHGRCGNVHCSKNPNCDFKRLALQGAIICNGVNQNIDKYIEIVALLLKQPGIDVNLKTYHNNTALHTACEFGRVEMVGQLLALSGIDPDIENDMGHTPLAVAFIKQPYLFSGLRELFSIAKQQKMACMQAILNRRTAMLSVPHERQARLVKKQEKKRNEAIKREEEQTKKKRMDAERTRLEAEKKMQEKMGRGKGRNARKRKKEQQRRGKEQEEALEHPNDRVVDEQKGLEEKEEDEEEDEKKDEKKDEKEDEKEEEKEEEESKQAERGNNRMRSNKESKKELLENKQTNKQTKMEEEEEKLKQAARKDSNKGLREFMERQILDLEEELECPVCLEVATIAPIYKCLDDHLICRFAKKKVSSGSNFVVVAGFVDPS